MRAHRPRGAAAAILLVGCLILGACSVTVAGHPQRQADGIGAATVPPPAPRTTPTAAPPAPDTDGTTDEPTPTGTAPQLPTNQAFPLLSSDPAAPSGAVPDDAVGLKPDAPKPGLPIIDRTSTQADVIAAHTLADLFDYYEQIMPADFGIDYRRPRLLVSYDSTERHGTVCGLDTYEFVNAFYAASCDTVAWDRAVMLPQMIQGIGSLAPAVVLSHEIGHDVQDELGIPADTPSIVLEQQADCYAGAYWRWVADGNSDHFLFNQTEGMRQLLLALFDAHDPVDIGSGGDDTDDHGNGFDRTYAATLGYTSGAVRCSTIDADEIAVRGQEFPFDEVPVDYGNIDLTDQSLAEIAATVDSYFGQTSPGYVPPTLVPFTGAASPACDGYRSDFPVAYCPTTNTVSYQLAELRRIAAPAAAWDSASGDFSAIVLLVSRYALAAQHAGHSQIEGKNAGLRALCYAGTWATWMRTPRNGYSLSPTDLDKAIYQIVSSSTAGSDVNGESAATIIERVQAFDIGVTHLIPECFDFYPH